MTRGHCTEKYNHISFRLKVTWYGKPSRVRKFQYTEVETAVYRDLVQQIWHSADRASWHILIIKTNKMPSSQIYFWNRTLHVSGRVSVYHQESSTLYTAIGIRHTGYADCLLARSGWNSAKPVWHIPIAVNTVLDSWWLTEKLSETCRVLFQK
jgi:predicted phage tail protein